MNKGSLLLVPAGGLANRMRAVVSAYNLCKTTESSLQVVWIRDWALNAPFHDIFEPVDDNLFSLREARFTDYLLNDRPRRRNLWIPRWPQKIMYERCIYEQYVTPLKQREFDFEQWLRGHRCYMSCYQEFGTYPHSLYSRIFRPVPEVMKEVDGYCRRFTAHTIGMHIRRTDNAESISKSPTRLFIDAGRKALSEYPDLRIFLATDSDGVKREMRDMFGEKIITPCVSAQRGNTEGIRGAVAEMWTLSRTMHIYGSAGSSFSTMAASVGGKPVTILTKD